MSNDRPVLLACDPHQTPLQAVADGQCQALAHGPYGHRPEHPGLAGSGFNGQWREPETGWYLLGNGYRAYNPVLMRFHQPDSWSPFGGGGLNPYVYCLGDPINHRDPTAHMAWFGALGLEALGGMAARAPVGAAEGGSAEASPWSWISIILGVAAVGAIAGVGAGLKDKLKGLSPRRPQSPPLDVRRETVISFAPRVSQQQVPSTSSAPHRTSTMVQGRAAWTKERQGADFPKIAAAIDARNVTDFKALYSRYGNKGEARKMLRERLPSTPYYRKEAELRVPIKKKDLEWLAANADPTDRDFVRGIKDAFPDW
ncbi:RHS repeat-associated core domain-containing protein [Pseudomonas japonica]|uniref:RHS repeat-associated core domain-containing protein n=1 Tax=Pseudomonas japonica TaxID=256466 RepID=A0A239B2C4_9PSED|nr:RHS repeat-associated core domain-containing protein [Pseudomonas japonica]SNS02106.1 RHS repeat-associated core domain-containing protein [Pseudomonas japonica]